MTEQTQDGAQAPQQENRLVPVKVSRREELAFGPSYAPLIRRLGEAADAAEQATYQVEALLRVTQEQDAITSTVVDSLVELDRHGRSPVTVWLEEVHERTHALRRMSATVLRDVSGECIAQEARHHEWPDRAATDSPYAEVDPEADFDSERVLGVTRDGDPSALTLKACVQHLDRLAAISGAAPGRLRYEVIIGHYEMVDAAREAIQGAGLTERVVVVLGESMGKGAWMLQTPAGAAPRSSAPL